MGILMTGQTLGSYTFFTPGKIVFGWGKRTQAGSLAKELGTRALIVCGSRTLASSGRLEELTNCLREAGVEPVELAMALREPHIEDVDNATDDAIRLGVREDDLVVAIGGGAAIDLAKAVAAMVTNRESPTVRDYLEGIGKGLVVRRAPLPVLAIPTTSGTGSEATKNAVISSTDPPTKKSLRSDRMVPRTVLLDPELTVSSPKNVTAWSGMDAITQLIESYISKRSAPIPRAIALQGIRLAAPAIETAVEDGSSRWARESMSHAAMLSGMALANAGLGLAHGVAAALGSLASVPHGLACAVMLPVALAFNRPVCEEAYAELASVIPSLDGSSRPAIGPDHLIQTIRALSERLEIPTRLSTLGVTSSMIPDLVRGSQGNSLSGNPRDISEDELAGLLSQML
jgi:alcohol dehydrogenase class IV